MEKAHNLTEQEIDSMLENNTKMRKALFYTNMAYLLSDVAQSAALRADCLLKSSGENLQLKKEELSWFRNAQRDTQKAKQSTELVSQALYKLRAVDNICDTSDELFTFFAYIMDRVSGNPSLLGVATEFIKRFPSKLNMFSE